MARRPTPRTTTTTPNAGSVRTADAGDARREFWLLLAVLLCGIALRLTFLSRTAIEHFDEGVYASNWWFEQDETFEYPNRHLYAPPLLPALIEWTFVFLGPGNVGALLVSLAAGCATPLLVWWVGRKWFGSAAAMTAALLAATSEVHALFSRAALTDVLVGFWMLLAVWLIWESLCSGRIAVAVAGGGATALAWWTKYSGWLPLAISAAGLAAWIVWERPERTRVLRALRTWGVATLTAVLLWLPYLQMLQPRGGYAAVAANHRSYVVGWSGWLSGLMQQYANLSFLEGFITLLGLAVALPFAAIALRGDRLSVSPSPGAKPPENVPSRSGALLALPLAAAGFLIAAAALLGTPVVFLLLTAVGLAANTLGSFTGNSAGHPVDALSEASNRRLAGWMLAAWFVSLLLTTPLYRPYVRLTLPWLIAAWLASGAGLAALLTWLRREVLAPGPSADGSPSRTGNPDEAAARATRATPNVPRDRALLVVAAVLLVGSLVWRASSLVERGTVVWQSRTGLLQVAEQVAALTREQARSNSGDGTVVVYVYAEPALLFQLRLAGVPLVAPVTTLTFAGPDAQRLPFPTYLAAGPHALRDPRFHEQLAEVAGHLVPVETFGYQPSDLVLLDEYSPGELSPAHGRPAAEVRLYRVK